MYYKFIHLIIYLVERKPGKQYHVSHFQIYHQRTCSTHEEGEVNAINIRNKIFQSTSITGKANATGSQSLRCSVTYPLQQKEKDYLFKYLGYHFKPGTFRIH